MLNDIKFSIVMPSYNAALYIQEAIDSIINQTYRNFELIVVDGGSSDRTLEILNLNQSHISVLISEPDNGQSDAFNKGFALASGDFYLWLNADDLLAPQLLELAADFLNKFEGCNWLAFNTIFIDNNGFIKRFHRAPPWISNLNINHRPQVECPTSIFHNNLLREAGGFDLRLDFTMDLDLWRTFISNGHRWFRLDYYGYIFRIHNESKTNKPIVPASPTFDEITQAEVLRKKHNIKVNFYLLTFSRVVKFFYCLPSSIIKIVRWKGKHVSKYFIV